MLGSPPPPIDDVRKPRSDGEKSRERLLVAGLALFSERGFARTSTREIALAAGANVASISYYFGDKAGLYRSVFAELMPHDLRDLSRIMAPGRPLRAALHDMFGTLLAPLREGAMARQCMHMWLREMLEPTGVWQAHLEQMVTPAHAALTRLLARALEQPSPTRETGRLAICVVGLALQTAVQQEVIERLDRDTLASPAAVDEWIERLADYAVAMVEAERVRLQRPTPAGQWRSPAPAESKSAASKSTESKSAESKSTESKSAESKPAGARATRANQATQSSASGSAAGVQAATTASAARSGKPAEASGRRRSVRGPTPVSPSTTPRKKRT